MSRFPQYNVNNEHQLIRRQNTYVLDRKLVTIHSDDRDINQWPNSNHFEITVPDDITNVQSLRLVEIQLPNNQYVFSNSQQNTKLQFTLAPRVSTNSPVYYTLASNINVPYTITIQEGFYTPSEMASEIESLMNNAVTEFIQTNVAGYVYTNFKVYYDAVGQQMYFGNTYDSFTFTFDNKIDYNIKCNNILTDRLSDSVFERYTKWGLGSYLGFPKEEIVAEDTSGNITFNYANYTWLIPDSSLYPPTSPIPNYASYIKAPYTISMFGESAVYMEIDKYNSIDELKPYSEATNNTYNNDYNGRVKSAFAKIPITALPQSQIFDSRNGFLQNVSQYHPPIDKIRKLKFTFRYHDGRLVEFKDANFNFTLAFNQLKDEIARDYEIRIPAEYNL